MGHADVEADAIALRAWLIHLLEPDRRALSDRVDDPILGAVGLRFVGIAQHCIGVVTTHRDYARRHPDRTRP